MQTLIHKTDYHGLVRIEKEDITLYKIYNLVTKKARCDVEIKGTGKKLTEESIKRVSEETMQDLDKKFETSTKAYVNYPVGLYKRHLLHIFKKILTKSGFSIRLNQVIVARLMFNAAMQGNISLCEAEVGTGKTHAYLVALLMYRKFNFIENTFKLIGESDDDYVSDSYRKPIIISTSSIALQNAIIKDYVPQLSRLLIREDYDPLIKERLIDSPLSPVIRKGKEHYICDKRLLEVYNNNSESSVIMERLISAGYDEIDLDNMHDINGKLKDEIKVPLGCRNSCELASQCRFRKLLGHLKSKFNQIQICNHNYFLADIKQRKRKLPPLLPSYSAVVIDEAHKLEEVARQMYGDEIASKEVKALVDVTVKVLARRHDIDEIISTGDKIKELNTTLFDQLIKNIVIPEDCKDEDEIVRFKTSLTDDMLKDMNRIRNGLERISKAIEIQGTMEDSKKKKKDNTQDLFYRVNGLIEKVNSFIKNSDNIIYWLEEAGNKYRTKLCCIPKNLDVQLYNDIFQNKFPVILTSGTMSVDGEFNFLKSRLGMTKVRHRSINEISVKSPFDYENNCIIYIKDNMPYPDYKDKNYIDIITQQIGELIKATDGRTMVLFTSYRVLNTVYQGLAHMMTQYTFLKSARSDITIIDKFKGAHKPVLFATGSCWEGIDIPGDSLSSLIIVKLPFPVPDPILEYKRSLLQTEDEFRKEVLFPEMIIKLKQGFGRLIRKETDTGVVSILDSRLNAGKSFRDEVLKCLPKCNVVNSIDSVREFIKEQKDGSYFQ